MGLTTFELDNTTIFSGLANSKIQTDLEVHSAQQAVDDLALDINTQRVHTFVAMNRLIRPTRQDEEPTKVKRVKLKVTETTRTNEGERQETERLPLRIVINTQKDKQPTITESTLVINEVIDEAIAKIGNINSEDMNN